MRSASTVPHQMQSKLRSQPKINQGFHSRRKKHEYIKKSPDPYFRKFGKGGKESISLWRCLLATTCLCQGGCLLKTTAPKRLTTVQEITCVLCRKCEPNQKSTASVRCASRKVNVIYASIHRNTLAAEDGRKLNVCILLSAVEQDKSSNRKNHTIVHPNARKNTCWLWAVQAQIGNCGSLFQPWIAEEIRSTINLQVVLNASYTAFKCFCPKNLNAYMTLKTSEPSGTSQFICTRTFRNLTEHLHRNPPEPSGTLPGTWC